MLFGGGAGEEVAVLNITRVHSIKLETRPRCAVGCGSRGGRSLHGVGADEGALEGQAAAMIPVPSGARVWLASGHTDTQGI
jgi:hypothetical protein